MKIQPLTGTRFALVLPHGVSFSVTIERDNGEALATLTVVSGVLDEVDMTLESSSPSVLIKEQP